MPEEIFQLTGLESLGLGGNRFNQFPGRIFQLKNLEGLGFWGHNLTEFPREILELKNLQTLTLDGNKNLISPPPAVVKQGLKAILEYLKALEEKTTVWSSKMVLVGEGGVGKTCLLDALEGKDFVPDKDTTHGIDTRKLTLPCPGHNDKPCSHLFNLEHLERRLTAKPPRFTIQCPRPPRMKM